MKILYGFGAAPLVAQEKTQRLRIDARARYKYNPLLCLSENEFKRRYRISKRRFNRLCAELKRLTSLRSSRRVSLELKVLTSLSFFATGSYQRPIGAGHNVCQKKCSDYIREVTDALIDKNIIDKYIQFPTSLEARQTLSQRFYRAYGIPGVIGCIDCTHIKIVVPRKEEEHWFYSRKHCHSLNVQMICDDKCRILNVNPKFGGCNHDSFVWENSEVNDYLQALHRDGERVWLLGDSGYPQRPWLMTPFHDATSGSPEAKYNYYHMQARVLIENTFSRLKNRWRCLLKDRVLHYRPLKCAKIVLACSVLHNFAIDEDLQDIGKLNFYGFLAFIMLLLSKKTLHQKNYKLATGSGGTRTRDLWLSGPLLLPTELPRP
ncbi:hypothetical protein ABMA28_012461 [Loxostege sticticalis]|uniref:DDE Tnp4 domain-containing protein n=1 Tax=Loxostege sticticalis TaxID=481309 RepID=A0ABD0S3Y0_LOXSC